MKPHMIFEIVLLILLAFVTLAAYACCVVAGKCSRIEEQRDNTFLCEMEDIYLSKNPEVVERLKKEFRGYQPPSEEGEEDEL